MTRQSTLDVASREHSILSRYRLRLSGRDGQSADEVATWSRTGISDLSLKLDRGLRPQIIRDAIAAGNLERVNPGTQKAGIVLDPAPIVNVMLAVPVGLVASAT